MTVTINVFPRRATMEQSFKNKQRLKMSKEEILHNRTSPLPIRNGKNHRTKRRPKTPTAQSPQSSNKLTILPRGASVPNLPTFSSRPANIEGSQNFTVPVGQIRTPNKPIPGNRTNNKPRRYSPSKFYNSGSSSSSSDECRSPKDNYAGATFHLPPEPTVLPKPPTHWVKPQSFNSGFFNSTGTVMLNGCGTMDMSSHLKTLLKVQVQA